ncbi:hypothetical protein P7D22_04160 [Lichenihabitans sp. Uapishka_5]|uniref:hypothetical protein n=1 Tax=Lichenihabitans sp. Uapishka_5 TaxID=3037302 RepID=UPI0029E817A4|nr:hypothetical protein [Lichenihabitans sp. Uapishka_5]MDX7950371.1 hypothetical protein [Lichenihabitans sp. Uapishka_5]
MSDLKIVPDEAAPPRAALPVPASEATFTRRDLDLIKRDLITVRKDYHDIRNNLVVLTHQHSSAPTRSFFLLFGLLWLLVLTALLLFQPQLARAGAQILALLTHGSAP